MKRENVPIKDKVFFYSSEDYDDYEEDEDYDGGDSHYHEEEDIYEGFPHYYNTFDDEIAISFLAYKEETRYTSLDINDEYNNEYTILYKKEFMIFEPYSHLTLYPTDDMFIYFNKRYENESLHLLSIESKYFKITLPHVNRNIKFFKNYGITFNDYFVNDIYEYQIPIDCQNEVKLFYSNLLLPAFSNSIIFGFPKEYYPDISSIKIERIVVESKEDQIYHFHYKSDIYYFESFKTAQIFKCKNSYIDIYVANNYDYKVKKIKDNEYIDFSEYSNDYIYEINTKEDFLLFIDQKKDIRKNKNITLDKFYHKNNVINSTTIFIEKDEYSSYKSYISDIIYIFAKYDENYFENFQNECYLYEMVNYNKIDNNMIIINNNIDFFDFKDGLRKDIKLYIFTKIVQLRNEKKNMYFYYPAKIEVTQWVLDSVFKDSKKSKSIDWKWIIIIMIITFMLSVISIGLKKKKKNNNIVFNLNNNNNNENLHPILND